MFLGAETSNFIMGCITMLTAFIVSTIVTYGWGWEKKVLKSRKRECKMALIEAHLYSEVLMKEVSVSVILPLPTIANLEYGKLELPGEQQNIRRFG